MWRIAIISVPKLILYILLGAISAAWFVSACEKAEANTIYEGDETTPTWTPTVATTPTSGYPTASWTPTVAASPYSAYDDWPWCPVYPLRHRSLRGVLVIQNLVV